MKVHMVKDMFFPVVMYGCESQTIKRAECQRMVLSKCGVGEDPGKALELQEDKTSQS